MQSKSSECLEGLHPGQTHPQMPLFQVIEVRQWHSSRNTLLWTFSCSSSAAPLTALRAPSCRLFIFLQKQSTWTFVQSVPCAGGWFFSMCGKNNARGASSANRVFLMCLMHLLFALPPFYLLPQSAKTELVQVLLVPQYKEPARIRVFCPWHWQDPFCNEMQLCLGVNLTKSV